MIKRRQLGLLLFAALCPAQDLASRAAQVLQKNCYTCHGASKTSGLDLRTRESILRGGERGPAVVPFKAEESRLFQFASHAEEPSMPPGKHPP